MLYQGSKRVLHFYTNNTSYPDFSPLNVKIIHNIAPRVLDTDLVKTIGNFCVCPADIFTFIGLFLKELSVIQVESYP